MLPCVKKSVGATVTELKTQHWTIQGYSLGYFRSPETQETTADATWLISFSFAVRVNDSLTAVWANSSS